MSAAVCVRVCGALVLRLRQRDSRAAAAPSLTSLPSVMASETLVAEQLWGRGRAIPLSAIQRCPTFCVV